MLMVFYRLNAGIDLEFLFNANGFIDPLATVPTGRTHAQTLRGEQKLTTMVVGTFILAPVWVQVTLESPETLPSAPGLARRC